MGGRATFSLDCYADLVLDPARVLYRYWPDLSGDRPFEDRVV